VLYAGPLAGSETGRIRALVIIDANNEVEIRRRLADDPWTLDDHLVTTSIEPGCCSSVRSAWPARPSHNGRAHRRVAL